MTHGDAEVVDVVLSRDTVMRAEELGEAVVQAEHAHPRSIAVMSGEADWQRTPWVRGSPWPTEHRSSAFRDLTGVQFGLRVGDIELVEVNEAFGAQIVSSARPPRNPHGKLNVHGDAIALGHPFGMTGARIMTTLLNGLDNQDKMCVGGGQGMATIVERLA